MDAWVGWLLVLTGLVLGGSRGGAWRWESWCSANKQYQSSLVSRCESGVNLHCFGWEGGVEFQQSACRRSAQVISAKLPLPPQPQPTLIRPIHHLYTRLLIQHYTTRSARLRPPPDRLYRSRSKLAQALISSKDGRHRSTESTGRCLRCLEGSCATCSVCDGAKRRTTTASAAAAASACCGRQRASALYCMCSL